MEINYPKNKDNHVIQNITGAAYAGLGRYNESLEYYRMAIATYPSYPDVYNNFMEVILSYLKQTEMAQYFPEKALILKPFYPEALQNFMDILSEESIENIRWPIKRLLFKRKPDSELEYKESMFTKTMSI